MAIKINTTTITASGSAYPVYEVAGIRANRFLMRTGASRYGSGQFLMQRSDWDQINGEDTAVLKMEGAPGPGLTLTVVPSIAEPVVTTTDNDDGTDLMKVTFVDVRCMNFQPYTKSFNVMKDGFTQTGSDFDCYDSTKNGSGLWDWLDVMEQAGGFASAEIPDDYPTWTPYNLIWDGVPQARVCDDIAGRLFYVVAFDHQAANASDPGLYLHNPGDTLDPNDTLHASADQYVTGGGMADRNDNRFPSSIDVTFQGYNADDPTTDPYAHRTYVSEQDVPNGSDNYTTVLHVGETIALWSGGDWTNQSDMDDIAQDVADRAGSWIFQDFGKQEYPGIWPFRPDGSWRQVEWISDSQGARTILSTDNGYDWKCIDGLSDTVNLNANQEVVGLGLTNANIAQSGTKMVWGGPGGGDVVVKIEATATGSGKYTGHVYNAPTTCVAGTAEAMPEGLAVGNPCTIVNTEETGLTGWRLAIPCWAVGTFKVDSNEDEADVVFIRGAFGSRSSPIVLSTGSYGSPDSADWDRDRDGVGVTIEPPACGFDASSGNFWFNQPRAQYFDARGELYHVDAETQTTIGTNACP